MRRRFLFPICILISGYLLASVAAVASLQNLCFADNSIVRLISRPFDTSPFPDEVADGGSFNPVLSATGDVIIFESNARNLVADDMNPSTDIFQGYPTGCEIRMLSPKTDLVDVNDWSSEGVRGSQSSTVAFTSRVSTGEQRIYVTDGSAISEIPVTEGSVDKPALSADGRFIVYTLTPPLTDPSLINRERDIIVLNRQTGRREKVSVGMNGTSANGASDFPSISADGRFVAFQSDATNLVPNDINGVTDVFLFDRETWTMTLISQGRGGEKSDGWSIAPALSSDGRFVAFTSAAGNLVPGDSNNASDVFVYSVETGEISRVSVGQAGSQGDGDSDWVSISMEGRFIAFRSVAGNLVPGDTNDCEYTSPTGNCADIFVHDRMTAATTRVSISANGYQAEGESGSPSISADGRWVAFHSTADNLVANDGNGYSDVFLVEWTRLLRAGTPLPTPVPTERPLFLLTPYNGDFSLGMWGWNVWDAITYRVSNGVFEFYRNSGGSSAVLLREINSWGLLQDSAVRAQFDLGNSSSVRKRVSVVLHTSDFGQVQTCSFWLSPNSPMRSYTMLTYLSNAWPNMTISFYASPADGEGWIQLDNVSWETGDHFMLPVPTQPLGRTQCFDPTAPLPLGAAVP